MGYVLWMRTAGGDIKALSLAQTWRHPGAVLSASACRSASTRARTQPRCVPVARFSARHPRPGNSTERSPARIAATCASSICRRPHLQDPSGVQLAPMLAPKPSAGNYLDNTAVGQLTRAAKDAAPLREWGSQADEPEVRGIAGRKYYWHTSLRDVGPRHELGNHQGKDNAGEVVEDGGPRRCHSTFTGRLVFEAITPAQLGSILALLDPSLLCIGEPGGKGSDSAQVLLARWRRPTARPGLGHPRRCFSTIPRSGDRRRRRGATPESNPSRRPLGRFAIG